MGVASFLASGARQVTAFDISSAALATAKGQFPDNSSGFTMADALRLPLGDHAVDVYICLETIEHVSDDRALLQEVKRVLRNDGQFVCSTPNRTVTNPGSTLSDAPWNRFHVREYSREEFDELLGAFFHDVKWFGQNAERSSKVRFMSWLAILFSKHTVVRFSQLLKAPRLLRPGSEHHAVQPWRHERTYEYLLAVCSRPRHYERIAANH